MPVLWELLKDVEGNGILNKFYYDNKEDTKFMSKSAKYMKKPLKGEHIYVELEQDDPVPSNARLVSCNGLKSVASLMIIIMLWVVWCILNIKVLSEPIPNKPNSGLSFHPPSAIILPMVTLCIWFLYLMSKY